MVKLHYLIPELIVPSYLGRDFTARLTVHEMNGNVVEIREFSLFKDNKLNKPFFDHAIKEISENYPSFYITATKEDPTRNFIAIGDDSPTDFIWKLLGSMMENINKYGTTSALIVTQFACLAEKYSKEVDPANQPYWKAIAECLFARNILEAAIRLSKMSVKDPRAVEMYCEMQRQQVEIFKEIVNFKG